MRRMWCYWWLLSILIGNRSKCNFESCNLEQVHDWLWQWPFYLLHKWSLSFHPPSKGIFKQFDWSTRGYRKWFSISLPFDTANDAGERKGHPFADVCLGCLFWSCSSVQFGVHGLVLSKCHRGEEEEEEMKNLTQFTSCTSSVSTTCRKEEPFHWENVANWRGSIYLLANWNVSRERFKLRWK